MLKTYHFQNKHGAQLQNLWNAPAYCKLPFVERGFAAPKELVHDAILFVGLNPSYTKEARPENVFYKLNQQSNGYQAYFKKFEEVSQRVGIPWTHLDMLYIRETKQSNIKELLNQKHVPEFFHGQIQITKSAMGATKPRCIIVANTMARHLLGKDKVGNKGVWADYDFEFNEKIGTYRITTDNSGLQNTPVFFTSMLSGQRALDKGSYERLIWHIKQVA